MNFNFVTHRLAVGSAIDTDADVQTLINAGITHIIDCRAEFDDAPLLAKYPQIKYLYNGVDDDMQAKPIAWFEKSISFALEALSHPGNKVYSHCAAGINRGPSTGYAILRALGLSGIATEALIRFHRPIAMIAYASDADVAIKALKYE